ncbi:MAG: hypothetical protein ACD_54C00282G0001 [uncultured bacterium]|nr:MAG: hypothetical protein ACD_54C00282G0001 [uncultured bacterium]
MQVLPHDTHHRFRAATNADPCGQALGVQRWVDDLVFQRRAGLALPCQAGLAHQFGEDVEFFFEQKFIIIQRKAEQRVAFGKAAAAKDHLGATVGDGVEGGEALEHPDRIIR